ncbi:hypothetical protein [Paenibacillus whitsoniae]|uniref:Uncharacterized protein n=1 Tax=Paenibacillus whitsoniae TaxID=2496558 RepID=A0A3S0CFW6_9BACL|nr:hypothetical protein [Paenibacillus whitsoniae]RTE11758.1 hypothetical protein EJQ19_00150 [Paenibacillus whitsoniae]
MMQTDKIVIELSELLAQERAKSGRSEDVSHHLRSAYRTMYQKEETELVKQAIAAMKLPRELDVIHAGDNSIQIFTVNNDTPYYISSGLSDLNQQFDLLQAPHHRQIATCIKWLSCRFPTSLGSFVFIGKTSFLLRHSQIELEEGLYCLRHDFIPFAQKIALQPLEELEANSPFSPAWMRGSLASNCIVLAALIKSGAPRFMPYGPAPQQL